MACLTSGSYIVDIRAAQKSVDISLDISRHIPQRMIVGQILVLTDNPRVFLSVVRKRLARLADAVELRRCQTMDSRKRAGLQMQVSLLRTSRFSAKLTPSRHAQTVFITPEELACCGLKPSTIYLTTPLLEPQLRAVLGQLQPGGLLVTYGQWPAYYQSTIDELHDII